MKKTIGLALLLLTGLTAFAAPVARTESFHKTVVVAHKSARKGGHHRVVRKTQLRQHAR